MKLIIITTIVGLMLSVTPAPVVPPDGVQFDPKLAEASVMGAYKGIVNTPIIGFIDVYSDSTIAPTVTSEYTTFAQPARNGSVWTYSRTFQIGIRGTYYDTITVTDSYGTNKREIVYQIAGPPVITGCR